MTDVGCVVATTQTAEVIYHSKKLEFAIGCGFG